MANNDNSNSWQKIHNDTKDSASKRTDYDAEYMNNKKADAVFRAERMTDQELIDAYEKNEKAYRDSMTKAPEEQKKGFLNTVWKIGKWLADRLSGLASVAKAAFLRVGLGKDGVNRVIENTRKDEEKAERQQKFEREISELDKNAVREEMRRRNLGKDAPENSNENNNRSNEPANGQPANNEPTNPMPQKEDPLQLGGPERNKDSNLGKDDSTRLDRLYLGAMGDEKYAEDFSKFKSEYEAYIKDYTGLNAELVAGNRADGQGIIAVIVKDERLGECAFAYLGNGQIEHFGEDARTEKLVNELEKLSSHYINGYDKDSQKSRTASGIYPAKSSVKSLVEEMKDQLKDGIGTKDVAFYGKTIECTMNDGIASFTVDGKNVSEFADKDAAGTFSEADLVYKAIKSEIDNDINRFHDKGPEKEQDSKDFKEMIEDVIKEREAEQGKEEPDSVINEPTQPEPENDGTTLFLSVLDGEDSSVATSLDDAEDIGEQVFENDEFILENSDLDGPEEDIEQ